MFRKPLAVASVLVLLMAVSAQAANRITVTNDANYQYLKNMGNVLKGATINVPLTLSASSGTASVSGTSTSAGGNTVAVSPSPVDVTTNTTVNVVATLGNYEERVSERLTLSATGYNSLNISYRADVGIARNVTRRPTSISDFVRSKALTAPVTAGSAIGGTPATDLALSPNSLSSKVKARGTLADPARDGLITQANVVPVTYNGPNSRGRYSVARPRTNLRKLYGLVGSEATIAASTAIAAGTDVSMEWRARTKGEAYNVKNSTTRLPVKDPTTPAGADWLTSDVVKVGGLTDVSTVYALQMSFDNRINEAIEQNHNTVAQNRVGLYIAQASGGNWVKATDLVTAGANAETDVNESLAAFLDRKINEDGCTLASLLGSWGLDDADQSVSHPYGVSTTGTGYSWAIVAGGGTGIFAVVPEPSTVALLISAGLGLAFYGVRRRSRK